MTHRQRSPAISVLMAVYNTDRYVAQAVESILNQTFTDFELIAIDDGSTDRSLKVLQSYAAQDPRIRLLSRENRGIPQTRNELLSLARGEFLAVMDSDDIALPDRLQNQITFLRQHPEVLWLGGAFELIDAQGRWITPIPLPQDDRTIKDRLRQGQTSFLHPTAMLRRSGVIQVGGYDESLPLAEDLDLWLKLAAIGAVANLPQTVVQYRLHGNSICDRHQGLSPKEVQIALERAWKKGLIAEKPQATIVCGWRPEPNPTSRYQFLLKYGWWAFNHRQRGTALFYGTQAIVQNPWSRESWKLLICAALKPFPKPSPQPECP